MNRRAYTLIELMIAVAIVGISSAIVMGAASHARQLGIAEMQRERVLNLLDYEAACSAKGVAPDRDTVRRLSEALPDLEVSSVVQAGTATLTVSWRPAVGLRQTRSLTVFTSGGAR